MSFIKLNNYLNNNKAEGENILITRKKGLTGKIPDDIASNNYEQNQIILYLQNHFNKENNITLRIYNKKRKENRIIKTLKLLSKQMKKKIIADIDKINFKKNEKANNFATNSFVKYKSNYGTIKSVHVSTAKINFIIANFYDLRIANSGQIDRFKINFYELHFFNPEKCSNDKNATNRNIGTPENERKRELNEFVKGKKKKTDINKKIDIQQSIMKLLPVPSQISSTSAELLETSKFFRKYFFSYKKRNFCYLFFYFFYYSLSPECSCSNHCLSYDNNNVNFDEDLDYMWDPEDYEDI